MAIRELEAEVLVVGEKHFIQINAATPIRIPVSDDNANAVKAAFCSLLQLLKSGPHKISLKDAKKDLFYLVAAEYLSQLNRELKSVHEEMVRHRFVDSDDAES